MGSIDWKIRHVFGPMPAYSRSLAMSALDGAWGDTRPSEALLAEADAIIYGEVARLLRRYQRAGVACGCDRCVRQALETIAWATRIAKP